MLVWAASESAPVEILVCSRSSHQLYRANLLSQSCGLDVNPCTGSSAMYLQIELVLEATEVLQHWPEMCLRQFPCRGQWWLGLALVHSHSEYPCKPQTYPCCYQGNLESSVRWGSRQMSESGHAAGLKLLGGFEEKPTHPSWWKEQPL